MKNIQQSLRTDSLSRALRWSVLGFGVGLALFTIVTQPFMSDDPLSQAFYIGTSLWLITSGLLWVSLPWAAITGLATAVGLRVLLDYRSVEQELFIIVMVGVVSAYAKPVFRATLGLLALLWILPGFFMVEDRELAVLASLVTALLIGISYLVGSVARRLRRDRDHSRRELARVQTSQREQRSVLARELHDNAISDLTSIVMKAQRLQLSHQDEDLKKELDAVLDRANLTIDRIGRIASLLRDNKPITGEDPLVLPSIAEGLQDFQEELHGTGIVTTVESTNGVTTLGPLRRPRCITFSKRRSPMSSNTGHSLRMSSRLATFALRWRISVQNCALTM